MDVLSNFNNLPLPEEISQIPGAEGLLMEGVAAAAGVALVFALLNCFLGLKLVRIWGVFAGLVIGFLLGIGVSSAFGLTQTVCLIIGVVLGLILAVCGGSFYLASLFVLAWIFGAVLLGRYLPLSGIAFWAACLGGGLVIALISLKFAEPIIIIVTSLFGGLTAGTYICELTGIPAVPWEYIIGAVLVIVGTIVQFTLESRKRAKKHIEKARKIREEESTENEVDKARALMEDLDKMPAAAETKAAETVDDIEILEEEDL